MYRFSQFNPQTNVTDQGFEEMERISGLELNDERRATIVRHLRHYEFFRAYEADHAGHRRWKEFNEIAGHLRKVIDLVRTEEELPGHLWSYVTDHAGINCDREVERLERLLSEFQALENEVTEARPMNKSDPWLPRLLIGLEREFILAGGRATGISNGTGKRAGRFVRFCDAALQHLPEKYRPAKSVGSRWETLFRNRKKGIASPKRNWVGKAHPALVHY